MSEMWVPWRSLLIGGLFFSSIASWFGAGCAKDLPRASTSTDRVPGESLAQRVARRESELTAQLYDGVIGTSPDCSRMAAFIRGFHAATRTELAELDLRRDPSDAEYLLAKREAWEKIVAVKGHRHLLAILPCARSSDYWAATRLVPSLARRSYCREPVPMRSPIEGHPVPAAVVVPSSLTEARRLHGNPVIQPGTRDAIAIAREGVGVVPVLKLCIDENGNVAETVILKTSCYPGYDAKLKAEIATWRYEPFRVDGRPTRVCTSVTVIYRPR